jgi:uncharacterized membrane protein YcaP (DUF421 family)
MDLVLRSLAGFAVILLVTRAVGHRELASLEPFDLIMLVVIGDLVQQGITQNDQSMTGAATVLFVIALCTVASAYLNFRFRWLRPLLSGGPIVVIENGKVIDSNMRRERLTVEELEEQARIAQIASLEDVRLGVLERNGSLSFIPAQSQDS